jgi:hypothetical protein
MTESATQPVDPGDDAGVDPPPDEETETESNAIDPFSPDDPEAV